MRKAPWFAPLCGFALSIVTWTQVEAAQACQKSLSGHWRITATTQSFHGYDPIDTKSLRKHFGRTATISDKLVEFGQQVCHVKRRSLDPVDHAADYEADPYPAYVEVTYLCAPGEATFPLLIGTSCDIIHFVGKDYVEQGSFFAIGELRRIR